MNFLRDEEGKRLFAQVIAQPKANGPRAVLSDWLSERGDPLGEFIALELKGSRSKRATEILKEHEPDWLGPIHPIADGQSITFKGGFLSSFHLDATASPRTFTRSLRRASGHPALSLVTSLTLRGDRARGLEPYPWSKLRHSNLGVLKPIHSKSLEILVAFLSDPVFDRLESIKPHRRGEKLSDPLFNALEKVRPGIVRV